MQVFCSFKCAVFLSHLWQISKTEWLLIQSLYHVARNKCCCCVLIMLITLPVSLRLAKRHNRPFLFFFTAVHFPIWFVLPKGMKVQKKQK